jgi:integrase
MSLTIKRRDRADGSCTWSLYFRPALPDGTSLLPVPGFTSPNDRAAVEAYAEPFRAALRKAAGRGEPAPKLPKVEDADRWFERYNAYQKELGSSDADKKATRWRKWIAPKIGDMPMASVTRNDVEDIRDALDTAIEEWKRDGAAHAKGTAISGKTAMNVWSCLTSSFKAATDGKRRDLRVLDGKPNPCLGVLPPGDKDSRKARRKTFLYPREASALIACRDVPREWREVYVLALYTYLRPGELVALTWGDVDLDAGHVNVTKAWDYSTSTVKKPKTASGVRKVPIEASLRPALERMKQGKARGDLVVPQLGAFGEDHLAQQFRKHLLLADVDRAELHESTRTHVQANFRSCRDSGITWLAMTGLGVDKIMRRAGHDMVQTTMGYVKQTEDLTGDLGVPFAPLPTSLLESVYSTPESVTRCDPNRGQVRETIVPEEGVEPPT